MMRWTRIFFPTVLLLGLLLSGTLSAAYGAAPAAPTSVVLADAPNDTGTVLKLTFARSGDDGVGANNVVSYKVFKRLPGKPATYLTPITATHAATYSLDITGLTAGQQYGVGVSAWNGTAASAVTVRWATPVDNLTPAPPGSLTVTDPVADQGTTLQVVIGKSPGDVVGGRVTSYMVSKRIKGDPFTTVTTIPATGAATYTYTVTGLKHGTTYGIGVRASDGTRFSTYVVRWRAPLDTVAPAPPRSPSLVNPPTDNGTTMRMKLTRSLDDVVGGDVVAYRFYKRIGTAAFTAAGSLPATKADTYTYTLKNLAVGTRYAFAVSAFDGSSESSKVVVSGDTGVPGPPRNVLLSDALGDDGTALTLQFAKSLDDAAGANDVTEYQVYLRTGTNPLAPLTTIPATGAASYQYTLRNLTRGLLYTVAVCSWDGFQGSTRITRTATPLDDTPPATPTGLTVTDVLSDDGTALLVAFNASADDNAVDPEVARYLIYRAPSATGAGTKLGEVVATRAATYQYNDTGLTAGTPYYYWVVATGVSGASTPTARVLGTAVDNRPVRAPLNLTAVDKPYDFGGVIDLGWDRSPDDGAGANLVVKYYVYRRMANVQQDPTKIAEVTATGATHYTWSDTNVPLALILYEYTVKAATSTGGTSAAVGPARAASEDNNVLVFEAPTNLTATDVAGDSGGKLTLSWRRSTSEGDVGPPPPPPVVVGYGGATAKGGYGGSYEFYRRTAAGAYGTLPSFTVSAAGTNDPMSYVDTGLTNGTQYVYKVRYRRYNQISGFTAEASAVPVANVSTRVATPEASAAAATEVAAGPSVALVNPPTETPAGQDTIFTVAAQAPGRSTVCLEYTSGGSLLRTAAATGSGSYQATLKLRTSALPAGTVVRMRAVMSAAGTTTASPATDLTIAAD